MKISKCPASFRYALCPLAASAGAGFASVAIAAVLGLALVQGAQAATVSINATVDMSTQQGGVMGQTAFQNPYRIANGDHVSLAVDFLGAETVTVGGQNSILWPIVLSNNNDSSFVINNTNVRLLGFSGTGGAVANYSLGTQSSGMAHIGPYLSNFLTSEQTATFSGFNASFDVQSIAVSPQFYPSIWVQAFGRATLQNDTTLPILPPAPKSTAFTMPLSGTSSAKLTTQAGGVSSVSGYVDCGGGISSSGYFDCFHQPNKAYYAIDMTSENASVVAAMAGRIVSVNGNSLAGLSGTALTMAQKCSNASYPCIVIDHGNGFYTEYREFTSIANNSKTGLPFKIGDPVNADAILGTLSGGHLHFQVMTFINGAFDSKSTNSSLAGVTVGGKLITDYKLGGSFQVEPSGNSYVVTGHPLSTIIYGQSKSTAASFSNNFTLNSTVSDSSATMTEGSPAYIWNDWTVPLDATFLSFDFRWLNVGDGDYLTLSFGDNILFNFLGTDFVGNDFENSGLIWIGEFAGQSGQLLFALNSVGERNAVISLGNLTVYTQSEVPEPGTLALVLLALGASGVARRPARRLDLIVRSD